MGSILHGLPAKQIYRLVGTSQAARLVISTLIFEHIIQVLKNVTLASRLIQDIWEETYTGFQAHGRAGSILASL